MLKWEDKEFIDMMSEVNRKGCVTHINGYEPMCPNYEPMYEEEHINRVVIKNTLWQDFVSILVHNGYETTIKAVGDEIEITWKDKEGGEL